MELSSERFEPTSTDLKAEASEKDLKSDGGSTCEEELSPIAPFDDVVDWKEWEEKAPTVEEIFSLVPAHCYERSLARSFFFVIRDLFLAGLCFYVWNLCSQTVYASLNAGFSQTLLLTILGGVYAFAQGTILTGAWVIGHECGHHAFSKYPQINNFVGYILHTALGVPYYSWQFTHNKHHKYTNHLIWGETHVPSVKPPSLFVKIIEHVGEENFPLVNVMLHLVLGWYIYLCTNDSGGKCSYTGARLDRSKTWQISHFTSTGSQIFPEKLQPQIRSSTMGLLLVLGLFLASCVKFGTLNTVSSYFFPVMVANGWLVLYTWLQHAHVGVPHFGESSFTWLRGALATVDRPYPWLVDQLHHHIGTTHVLHHLNFKIPHYHAEEATVAIRKKLGAFYRYDKTPILEALIQTGTYCHYVDGIDGNQYNQKIGSKSKSN
jgi:omega-6 fatty acid desaturase (delta-12 desaturase)